MARYINEDEFIAWVKEHWCAECQNDNGLRCRACWIDDAIDIVEEAPEADVVPKSEYEEVLSNWQKIHDSYDADCIEHYKYGRAEAAREIFEDIEKAYKDCIINSGGKWYMQKAKLERMFAELKKKYTKGINNDVQG